MSNYNDENQLEDEYFYGSSEYGDGYDEFTLYEENAAADDGVQANQMVGERAGQIRPRIFGHYKPVNRRMSFERMKIRKLERKLKELEQTLENDKQQELFMKLLGYPKIDSLKFSSDELGKQEIDQTGYDPLSILLTSSALNGKLGGKGISELLPLLLLESNREKGKEDQRFSSYLPLLFLMKE